jgi:hypothetical protein
VRSNNNANANGGLAYANANNASSNTNSNNGSRLANYDNRLYGVPSRDDGRLWARSPSLGNSNLSSAKRTGEDWKAET